MGVPIWPSQGIFPWGVQGSAWGPYTASGTVTSASLTLTTGWWHVFTGAHNTVQGIVNTGTTTATMVPASAAGLVFSDGDSTVIVNDGTGGTAAHYVKIHGQGP